MGQLFTALIASLMPRVAGAYVIYLTDLEGSRAKLEHFYAESGAFRRRGGVWHLNDGVTLVYGGDVPDRFFGSMFVIAELNRHFDENPGRVLAIAGNRDLKALRFRVELSDDALTRPPHRPHFASPDAFRREAAAPPDRLRRLHYILNQTMGSPAAFELRRRELIANGVADATDHAVMQSLIDDVNPGGPFLKLLGRMTLVQRLGSTLITHGGITPQNLGRVPGRPSRIVDINQWVRELNAWWSREVARFDGPTPWSGDGPRPGEEFHEYSMPAAGMRSKPESVITGRFADAHQNPVLPPAGVTNQLIAQGIHRVIVGHTPVGDRAVTIRTADGRFEMIWADNSYTPDESNVTWVKLTGPSFECAETWGRVRINESWRSVRSRTWVGHPSPVGARDQRGALVVGFDDAERLIATRTENFRVDTRVTSAVGLVSDEPAACVDRLTSAAPAAVDPPGKVR